jgi:hypothetical protein
MQEEVVVIQIGQLRQQVWEEEEVLARGGIIIQMVKMLHSGQL